MKIVATVTDVGAVVHAGGRAESRSCIVEIPDSHLPPLLLKTLAWRKEVKERGEGHYSYDQITFSLLDED